MAYYREVMRNLPIQSMFKHSIQGDLQESLIGGEDGIQDSLIRQ